MTMLSTMGCVHQTVVRTEPQGATVYVDGEYAGTAPLVVQRFAGSTGQLRVRAEQDQVLVAETVVERTEWFPWPALLAVTPFLAVPTLVIPLVGPFVCATWAIATSPTLAGLFFLRRYPEEVTLQLLPALRGTDGPLPTDTWTVPDDYAPNPMPLDVEEEPSPTQDNGGGAQGTVSVLPHSGTVVY
ncbi:MAG: PEGA domain-containing protein [Myxococcota bacterium]